MLPAVIAQKLGSILLPNAGGMATGYIFRPDRTTFYKELKKPSWNPPSWVFAPAWTTLYSSMGYASYLVWRDGGGFEGAKLPLALYGTQLAINWAWTPMFFGLESTKLGLVNFALLIPAAAATTYEFFKVNPVAGSLLIPYLMWLSFACFLNFTIHRMNAKSLPEKK